MSKYATATGIFVEECGSWPSVIADIWQHIPDELKESCTGKQLGRIMVSMHGSYWSGWYRGSDDMKQSLADYEKFKKNNKKNNNLCVRT